MVRRRRQQQNVGGGFPESEAELKAGHVFICPGHPVRFVNDDQIPIRMDDIQKTFHIVFVDLFLCPALASSDRLDGIQRTNHIIAQHVRVVGAVGVQAHCAAGCLQQLSRSLNLAWYEQMELFIEMNFHFRNPLFCQSGRRNDQNAADQSAQLEFPND